MYVLRIYKEKKKKKKKIIHIKIKYKKYILHKSSCFPGGSITKIPSLYFPVNYLMNKANELPCSSMA